MMRILLLMGLSFMAVTLSEASAVFADCGLAPGSVVAIRVLTIESGENAELMEVSSHGGTRAHWQSTPAELRDIMDRANAHAGQAPQISIGDDLHGAKVHRSSQILGKVCQVVALRPRKDRGYVELALTTDRQISVEIRFDPTYESFLGSAFLFSRGKTLEIQMLGDTELVLSVHDPR